MKEKWAKGTEEEAEKTAPLEQVCSALREELEHQNQQRMDALNKKFIPLVVTDEPSRKVTLVEQFACSDVICVQANFKISAMRILYELHTLKQRRAYMNLRAEIEQSGRVKVEKEVRKLREKISDLKVQITSITKGIPISQWDVLAGR